MKLSAKASKGKHIDVRDSCGSLNLTAQRPEDVTMLTRLYRHLSGIEYDDVTAHAVESLLIPIAPFTSGGGDIRLISRESNAEVPR